MLVFGGRGDYVAAGIVWYALQGVGVVNVAVVNGGFDELAGSLSERSPALVLLDDPGRIRPPDEVVRTVAGLGVGPDDPVLLYCQSGGRSAFVAMVLIHSGFRDVRNYVGSFGEWSRDEACPVESGGGSPAGDDP